jgi:surface protein
MEERPLLPLAKRPKTTQDDGTIAAIRTRGVAAAAKNDSAPTSIVDLLQSLPANIVANCMYPFAVKVIQDREELLKAVDEYLDENFTDDGEARIVDEDVGNNSRIRYPIGDWDVSRVDSFTRVFDLRRNRKAYNFNEDLSRWNVTSGTRFARLFWGCHLFQSDLSNWDTEHATNLSHMFNGCTSFQSDISRWNVANATNLSHMFDGCTAFQSNVSRWNVANATNLSSMFRYCTIFNSDVSRWNVANATDLSRMASNCRSFISDVSRWNTANATDLSYMFASCNSFNSDVSSWNTANASNLSENISLLHQIQCGPFEMECGACVQIPWYV